MLKKILFLAVFFALMAIPRAYCDTSVISKLTVDNDGANAKVEYVSTDTIVPNRTLIYGFSVYHTRISSFSPLVSLWDLAATTAWDESSLIGESEAPANSSKDVALPFPAMVANQLKVVLGPYSAVTIYYTK